VFHPFAPSRRVSSSATITSHQPTMSTSIDDETRLPPALLQRLIQEFVDDKKTKLSQPALSALGEYFSTFIREAIWRAAQVRKGGVEDPLEATGGKVFGSGTVFLEVCSRVVGWGGIVIVRAGRADACKGRGSGEGCSTAFDGFLESGEHDLMVIFYKAGIRGGCAPRDQDDTRAQPRSVAGIWFFLAHKEFGLLLQCQ
jgi:hypothetical protein